MKGRHSTDSGDVSGILWHFFCLWESVLIRGCYTID